jgi:hypothetical protein
MTSTSTVGFPRESMISRAEIFSMYVLIFEFNKAAHDTDARRRGKE